MKCRCHPKCECGNDARYVNARSELTCGLCPLKEKIDSIRVSDVAPFLAWIVLVLNGTGLREAWHLDKRNKLVSLVNTMVDNSDYRELRNIDSREKYDRRAIVDLLAWARQYVKHNHTEYHEGHEHRYLDNNVLLNIIGQDASA